MTGIWYIWQNQEKLGPCSFDQLCQLATLSLLQRSDSVWQEGTDKWLEAGSVEGIFPKQETARQYYLAFKGTAYGPYGGDHLRMLLSSGRIAVDTPTCPLGGTAWIALVALPEFSAYAPTTTSQAGAATRGENAMSGEEAELHLAGKNGDVLARLQSRLMDLKRRYADNPTLSETLDRNIQQLRLTRGTSTPTLGESQRSQPAASSAK